MKKLSLIAIFALISMLFFVSCGSDDEDAVDTETGDTTADTTADTTSDTQSDTGADTTDSAADTATDTDADTTDSTADTTADTAADTATDTTADTDADTTADTDADTTADTDADTTDSGADTTDTGSDTGADTGSEGGDNLNTGDTSGNQAQSGKVGAACTKDSQCTQTYGSGDSGQDPLCLTSNDIAFPSPNGYCSFLCDFTDTGACDSAGELCYLYSNYNGVCLHKCTKPSDCRVGYRCSNKIHACLPDCANSECKTGACDPTDKVCLKEKEN